MAVELPNVANGDAVKATRVKFLGNAIRITRAKLIASVMVIAIAITCVAAFIARDPAESPTIRKTPLKIAPFSTAATGGPQPAVGLYWYFVGDPTTGSGINAPQWQFGIRTDSSPATLYYKSGIANTAWTIVGGGGAGGVTGSCATMNAIAKWSGLTALACSNETDDGTTFFVNALMLFGAGAIPFSSGTIGTFNGGTPQTTTQFAIVENDTGHVGSNGINEAINNVLRNSTSFDCTVDGATCSAEGIDINVTASRATSGSLTNTAILANASGGDDNYSFYSDFGTLRNTGSASLGNTVTLDLQSGGALADLSGSTAIYLNANIAGPSGSPAIEMPGTSSAQPVFSFGVANQNDGTSIQIKNTNGAQTTTGIDVLIDTTIQGAERGGLLIQRGAGGVSGGFSSGVAVSGGTGFPFVGSTANSLGVFAEQGPIFFGANISAFTYGMELDAKDHLSAANTTAPTPTFCGSSPAAVIVGDDKWFTITTGGTATGCIITFFHSYTGTPICTISALNGITPTYSKTNTAITLSTGTAASTEYDVNCYGPSGG